MLELIPFTEADIDRLIGWVPTLRDHLLWTASGFEFPLTREPFRKFLAESAARGDRLFYQAVVVETGEVCGHIELGAIDPRNRSLRIGRVLVAPAFRGRGIGGAMMRLALRKAFEEHRVHRVELGVFDVNPRAIALYEKLGFQRDGTRRESFWTAEGFWSEVVMSILDSEWAALGPRGVSG
jgi:RimJ/RimL family protein N-acetyltransferase